jgi:competence protein ComEC
MEYASSFFWKEAPFTRLFFPFALGIITQENLHLHVMLPVLIMALSLIGFWTLLSFSSFNLYRWRPIAGVFLTVCIFGCGCVQLYAYRHNLKPSKFQFADNRLVKLVLLEPLSEKTNSYKAIARIDEIKAGDTIFQTNQKIIVYFKKDSLCRKLVYGDQIIFSKQLQQIRNSGNPGAFDYQQFCARQGIYEQVFLNPNEFVLLNTKETQLITQFLIDVRNSVIRIIKKYIPGDKEAGLAEALLIGYKDDLDKGLVSSYSGAGVVHIIAISGLHLGIIYGLLNGIFLLIKLKRKSKWIKPIFIITGLWLFSLIAGASASVLRSALMFSFIVIGECFSRRVSVYNTLAASAFILLWYNPYWLWDVGFQLSYLAVLSIVVFYKHVYALLYFNNKIADTIWKLNAITISAQILTLPITIYYFHQFPNYFLLANLIAIPLSSLILIGEILLCAISAIPFAAEWLGWLLNKLILIMNVFIEWIEKLPGGKLEQLQISQVQAIFLFVSAAAISFGILLKKKKAIFTGLSFLSIFLLLRLFSFLHLWRPTKNDCL